MAERILGLEAVFHLNTGTFAAPVWTPVTSCRDVTLNMTSDEGTFESRAGQWREHKQALKEASITVEFEYKPGDTEFDALKNAYLNRTNVDVYVADGLAATAGTEGLRAVCQVTEWPRGEPLNDAVTIGTATIRPTPNADGQPQWLTGPQPPPP